MTRFATETIISITSNKANKIIIWIKMLDNTNKKTIWWQDEQAISLLEKSLQADHCSITSTDTILGLLAPFTQSGFEQLNAIKGGRQNKPYLILISSPQKLELFVETSILSTKICELVERCWPGPVTFIFQAKADWPRYLVSEQGTIALRCPKHPGLLQLLESFDGLFSTSANKSGQEPPQNLDQIDPNIIDQIDYIVMDKDRVPGQNLPSTILDISDGKTIKVIREGAYPVSEI